MKIEIELPIFDNLYSIEDNSVDMISIGSPYGDNIRYNEHPDCIGKSILFPI